MLEAWGKSNRGRWREGILGGRRRRSLAIADAGRTELLEPRVLLSASGADASVNGSLDTGFFYWADSDRVPLHTAPIEAPAPAVAFSAVQLHAGVSLPTAFVTVDGQTRLWLTDQVYVGLTNASPDEYFTRDRGILGYQRVAGTTDQYVATVAGGAAASLNVANALHGAGGVGYSHPNFLLEVQTFSNDSLYTSQWNLHNTGQTGGTVDADIDAPEAWAVTTGSPDIVVAVLDVGTQLDHPDLVNNLFVNAGEIPRNGLDDDGNGWIDDVHGLDVSPDDGFTAAIEHDGDPSPGNEFDNHGTAVVGVIAAEAENGIGISGVAPGVKIMPIRLGASNDSGSFTITVAGMASAVYYAAGRTADGTGTWRGADVANHSYGTGTDIPALTDAFAWAANFGRDGRGLANFVSSGNGGGGTVNYPANLSTTIAVGATGHDGLRTSYSQYGTALDFVAPGGDGPSNGWLWTTDRTGGDGYVSGSYVGISGTSFSAPMAAGIAALMLSVDPTLTLDQMRQIMRDTADRDKIEGVVFDSTGFNLEYGYGWLNAAAAVAAVQSLNNLNGAFDDILIQQSDGSWSVAASNGSGLTTAAWADAGSRDVQWGDQVTGDFDGDGRTDAAARDQQTGQWTVWLSEGESFTSEVWGLWSPSKSWDQIHAGDFDGDGRTDIAGRIPDAGDGRWFVSLSTGSSFHTTVWGSWTTAKTWSQAGLGDFNGDGLADMVGRVQDAGDGRWFVSLSDGSRFLTTAWLSWSTNVDWGPVRVGDYDGDGRSDIASRIDGDNDGRWFVGLSEGSRFITAAGANFMAGSALSHVYVADFDGDGDDEIAARLLADGSWFVLNWDGSMFRNEQWGLWSTLPQWTETAAGDFNGDSRSDLAGRNRLTGDWQVAVSNGAGFDNLLWGKAGDAEWDFIAPGNVI